jgi:hypothetical protein
MCYSAVREYHLPRIATATATTLTYDVGRNFQAKSSIATSEMETEVASVFEGKVTPLFAETLKRHS